MWQNSNNRIIELDKVEELVAHWPFFVEGLERLNETCDRRGQVDEDVFFKVCLQTIGKAPHVGRIALLVSKHGKPLGFGVAFDNTQDFCRRSAIVYAVYSNGKCATATLELQRYAEEWAVKNGFEELHAVSRRVCGAANRLFEHRWGFRRVATLFKKELQNA